MKKLKDIIEIIFYFSATITFFTVIFMYWGAGFRESLFFSILSNCILVFLFVVVAIKFDK